jgi:hypothetical protein
MLVYVELCAFIDVRDSRTMVPITSADHYAGLEFHLLLPVCHVLLFLFTWWFLGFLARVYRLLEQGNHSSQLTRYTPRHGRIHRWYRRSEFFGEVFFLRLHTRWHNLLLERRWRRDLDQLYSSIQLCLIGLDIFAFGVAISFATFSPFPAATMLSLPNVD